MSRAEGEWLQLAAKSPVVAGLLSYVRSIRGFREGFVAPTALVVAAEVAYFFRWTGPAATEAHGVVDQRSCGQQSFHSAGRVPPYYFTLFNDLPLEIVI
jgi:hypothetical protein